MKRKLLSLAVALLCSVATWAQTPSPGDDMTSYITNPDATTDTSGWTSSNSSYAKFHAGPGYENNASNGFFELCNWNASWDLSFTQAINNLPNGFYLVKAVGQMSESTDISMKLIANGRESNFSRNGDGQGNISTDGTETEFGSGKAGWRYNGVIAQVTDGTLTIKVQGTASKEHLWANFDHVTLTYLGESIANNTDVSYFINNWDFQGCLAGDFNGWTVNNPNSGNAWPNGESSVEYWKDKAVNGSFDYYQELSDLPVGVYTLSASMWNSTNSEEGASFGDDGTCGVYGTSSSETKFKGVTTDSDNNALNTYTTDEFIVTDGNLRVGVKNNTTMTARWFGVDWIKLQYVEPCLVNGTTTLPSSAVAADTWYKISIASDADYFVHSSASATISYTTNGNQGCSSASGTNVTFSAGETKVISFTEGTLYLKADAATQIVVVAKENGANVTDVFITNPGFETGNNTGWDVTNCSLVVRNTDNEFKDEKIGSYYGFIQANRTNRDAHQTISSVPEGKYVLSAKALANSDAGSATLNIGANSMNIPVGAAASVYYVALETESVSDVVIKVDASGGEGNTRKVFFDNFTLTYYSTLPDVSITSLTSEAMAGDVRAALDDANTAYTGSKTVANYNALQTAIVNAKVSIAEFAAKTGADADWTGVIVNPTFSGTYTNGASGTTQGWTITGTSGNRQFNAGAAESWSNNNVVFSQVIKNLPAGTYKLTAQVDNCHEDANVALYATCNETTYSTAAPYRACTKNYATTSSDLAGDESLCLTTLYLKVEEGKDLTIGAKDESTSGGWMIFDNFKLTYKPTLPESVTAVEGKMNGTVESTQTSAVNTYNTTKNIDNLVAAQAAIYAATKSKVVYTEITTIKGNYDTKAAALDATGQAAYAAGTSATKYTNGTYVTASEAETAYHDDYIAAVKAQDTDNAVYTDVLVNPSFESGKTGWSWSSASGQSNWGDNNKLVSGRLEEGGGDQYLGFWTNCATGSKVYQTVNLPAGSYKLSAYLKPKNAGDVLTLSAKDQTTSKTTTDTNAFKLEVSFSITSTQNVEIAAGTTTSEGEYWMDDFQLILTSSYYANAADYAALNSAIESAEANTLGFENGEYAPYENISALTALAAANAINQSAANTKTSVQTATTDLTGATWTANVGDVECVYNGDFSQGDGLTGWTRSSNWGQQCNTTHSDNGTAYYNQPGSLTYGGTGLYTMPLKANTIYQFSFKYAAWDGAPAPTVSILCGEDGMEAVTYEAANVGYTESMITKTRLFVTGAAGNYLLTITGNNMGNIVVADVSITKAASQTLTLPSATQYAAGTYPAVELGRTFTTTNWATVCVPFAFDDSKFEVKELSDITVTGDHISIKLDDASTIEAGKPYLVKATADDAKIAATNVAMPGASVQESSITKDPYTVSFVGTYEGESLTSANSNAWVVSKNQLWNVDSNVTVGAYRAYFTVTGTSVKALVFGDEETGINNLNVDDDLNKNEVIYNLAGQRVQKAVKGLYIKNGKKVVIK